MDLKAQRQSFSFTADVLERFRSGLALLAGATRAYRLVAV
jgi:hypothetical protein